ncbi:MAG: ABC transporter permease [Gemmatimonadales bacterium]|nr:ABC transporter permease [Gemmatimonadales bacterium]
MARDSLDALELEQAALGRGLPRALAAAIGRQLARADLTDLRRREIFDELVAHFEDGLAAGRPETELLAEFGEADFTPPPPVPLPFPVPRRGDRPVSRLLRDLRYAGRRLLASPGFTAIAIVSLALGIGATTTVFSLINAVILRPSAIRDVAQVVDVYERSEEFPFNATTNPDYMDLRRGTSAVFSELAATRFAIAQVTRGGTSSPIMGEVVTGTYFPLLGVRAALGRLLAPTDDVSQNGHAVAVLGYGYWQRAFGGDSAVLGKPMVLNGRAYTVIGVVEEAYQGNLRGMTPDFYAPMMMVNHLSPGDSDLLQARSEHGLFVKARLREGIAMAAADAAVLGVAAELKAQSVGDWRQGNTFALMRTKDVIIFPAVDKMMYPVAGFMLTLVGLVLLVVCANLASFLLARGVDRRKEIAVRLALGATRARLLSQLLTETVLLGALGGAGGLAVSVALAKALTTANLPLAAPIMLDLSPDSRVLLFTTAVSLLAGILFGLVPALRASNPHLSSTLRDEAAGGGRRGRAAMRHGLVVAQVAISLVLLIAAGLFVRSMRAAENVDPGFAYDPMAIMSIVFPPSKYARPAARLAQEELASRLRELPGVTGIGMIDNIPLNQLNRQDTDISVPGVDPGDGRTGFSPDMAITDTGYFNVAGYRLLAGRYFSASDGPNAPNVAIINEALARRLWPGKSAVGQQFLRGDQPHEVVGVVATTKIGSLGEPPTFGVYFPLEQENSSGVWYVARTTADEDQTAQAMLRAAQAMDSDLIPLDVRSMTRHLGVVRLPMRLAALMVSALAILAVVLATIGLYGTMNYSVAQRTHEVGIRLALGAEPKAVVRMLMKSGLRLVALGSAVGFVLALLLARLISRLLFGVGALDPVTFVLVPIALVSVAALAAWLPARRATEVAPTEALRADG